MNELFDKFIIRLIFTITICIVLWMYRYMHYVVYPTTRKQIFKNFSPSENPADTLHFFGRLIGVGLLFSSLGFDEQTGLFLTIFNFVISGTFIFLLYLISLYITETIIFLNFEYEDEIIKRKNITYALICFCLAISLALIQQSILQIANQSLILLFLLWLYSSSLFGFMLHFYRYVSKVSLKEAIYKKDVGSALSFTGFSLGCSLIIISSFQEKYTDVKDYVLQSALKILLATIIFPLFRWGFKKVFNLVDDFEPTESNELPKFGHGVYEGAAFLICALLTTIITSHVRFETIYPLF